MSEKLRKRLAWAQLRLNLQTFLGWTTWSLTVTLAIGCVAIGADRLFAFGIGWPVLLAIAVGAGLVASLMATYLHRSTPLAAARVLDARMHLNERISTLISLNEIQRNDPVAEALAADVEQRVEKIDVAKQLPVLAPRYGWAPSIPLLLSFAIAYFVGPIDGWNQAQARPVDPQDRERIERETRSLTEKIAEKKEELEELGVSEELKDIAAELEKAAEKLAKSKEKGVEQTAMELSDMAKSLEDRKQKSQDMQDVKDSLTGLSDPSDGPAKELQKALREGDFSKAAKEMEKLRKQLEQSELSEDEKKKLQEQLEQMQKELQKAAERAKEAQKKSQQQLDPMTPEQLEQLAKQCENCQKLQELAQSLEQCANCMKGMESDGSGENSAEAQSLAEQLKAAEDALEQLALSDAEREALEQMLNDLNECRGGVCQKPGQAPGGNKAGRGSVQGEHVDPLDTKARPQQVRGKLGDGRSFIAGRAEGPMFKGESHREISKAVSSAARAADEAVTHQPVAEEYKEHTREYFERLHRQVSEEK